jgi:hypothetical protein
MLPSKTKELWAVLSEDGQVMYSRGGSSTSKKLLVYDSEYKAKNVLKSPWIKQIIPDATKVQVRKIYDTDDRYCNVLI